MQLNPMHLTVAQLLEGRMFKIPEYQRAYSWQSRQRKDMFLDISNAYHSGREHFMATIVALSRAKRVIVADQFNNVEVVDGQQRITTIVILLKAIENALGKFTDKHLEMVKMSLGRLLVKGDEHQLVLLQTNHDSSDVFTTYLRRGAIEKKSAATAAEKNIMDAVRECEDFVGSWVKEGKIIDLYSTIRNQLSVIYHELADEGTVYRVFEVLNSRGLDVKWIDKTKSQLMSGIFEHVGKGSRADSLNEMRTIWRKIYRTLGLKESLGNEALRFAGTFLADSRPNRVLSEEDASVVLVRYGGTQLARIIRAAEWLSLVVTLLSSLNYDVRRTAVTKIAHARFLAVAIMLRFEGEELEDLLRLWEKVTFRIFGLAGADSRHKVGDYVRLAYDLNSSKVPFEKVLEKLNQLGADYSLEELLKNEGFWDNCYEGWGEELRYLLYRYDEYLAAVDGEQINEVSWRRIWESEASESIEHIVPQRTRRKYTHHLGNLVILPRNVNSRLKDMPPKDKADAYIRNGIRGTAAVGVMIRDVGRWGKKEVKDRAKRIEEFVKVEWGNSG